MSFLKNLSVRSKLQTVHEVKRVLFHLAMFDIVAMKIVTTINAVIESIKLTFIVCEKTVATVFVIRLDLCNILCVTIDWML